MVSLISERNIILSLMMESIDRDEPIGIKAFFGAGKTEAVIDLVASNKPSSIVIVSEPLRVLRDHVAKRIGARIGGTIPVFRAHDEVCQHLSSLIARGYNYYQALSIHLRSRSCVYKGYVLGVIGDAISRGFMVTTHRLAPIASLILGNYRTKNMIIVDEAEDYITRISHGLPKQEIEPLKQDPLLWRRLKRVLIESADKYHYRPQFIVKMLRSILLSATPPNTLQDVFTIINNYARFVDPGLGWRDDVIIKYCDVIDMISFKRRWNDIANIVVDICSRAVNAGARCTVITKNKEMTSVIERAMSSKNTDAVSDLTAKTPTMNKKIYILTIGGRFYRGVSLPESDVIVAFFQRSYMRPENPVLRYVAYADKNAETHYGYEISMAYSLQSVYRSNRDAYKRHIMVFFDERLDRSLENFYYEDKRSYVKETIDIPRGGMKKIPELVSKLL
jgi:hypothetical protein